MKEIKYNSKERETAISEMNDLLSQLNSHVKYLREANKMLKKIDADNDRMEKYYFSDWLDDYNHFSSEKPYDVLSQDHIHNALQEIYIEKIKLLKKIVKMLP